MATGFESESARRRGELLDRVRTLVSGGRADQHDSSSGGGGPAGGRVLIGITGCPGAGKSTVAEWLARSLDAAGDRAVWVPMDGFHLAQAELERLGRAGRKGAIDTFDASGYRSLLGRIARERDGVVYAPAFDRRLEEPVAGSIPVFPETAVAVTEGNYLLDSDEPWGGVRRELTEVWYCEVDEPTRLARLAARHERFGKSPEATRAWIEAVDEPNARRIRKSRERADLVFDFDELGIDADPSA